MKHDDIRRIYDPSYVDTYEGRFQHGSWFEGTYQYDLDLYAQRLGPGKQWLDLACGTGWHLRQFPDVERVGLDLSPDMVERSRQDNPGAQIVQGSYLDPHPEWEGRFDLVTLTGWAYFYVDSLGEIETLVENMARWCSPSGTVLLWVGDSEELAYGAKLPWYDINDPRWWGQNMLAVIWDWEDQPAGVRHERLIAPQAATFGRFFGRHFKDVFVQRYPLNHQLWMRQKAIVATDKRTGPIEIRGDFLMREEFPPADHPLEVRPPHGDVSHEAPPSVDALDAATPSEIEPEPPVEAVPQGPGAPDPAVADDGVGVDRASALASADELTRWQHLWRALPPGTRRAGSRAYRLLPSPLERRVRRATRASR